MQSIITSAEEIETITPYSYRRRPERLNDRFSAFVSMSSNELNEQRPGRVDIIVATPATKWSAEGQSITLFAFARFRRYFTIIEDLSPGLATVYLETGILPVVAPVRAHLRRHTFELRPALMTFIGKEGLQLYSSRHD